MKKILVCAAIILCSSAQAQIKIGVKAGGNLYDNYETGEQHFTSEAAFGFHVGAYGDYEITDKLFVRLEGLFSTRGLHLKQSTSAGVVKYTRESAYIDIPVSANYLVFDRIALSAGVTTSVFLNEYRSETTDEHGYKVAEGDQYRSYERFQFGVFAGASYPFDLFGRNFEGGLRYNLGLTNTTELLDGVPASQNPKYRMLQASLAMKLFNF